MKPTVSVVMPAYNAAEHISESIQSILDQTLNNFELIIVDDSSTDSTAQIIEKFVDNRIRLIRNDRNEGVASSLNKGIAAAKGEFIARMDADDISVAHRLKLQVEFLRQHPSIALCGGSLKTFGAKEELWECPTDPDRLACRMLFKCEVAHPTVIMRKNVLDKYGFRYSSEMDFAEDYDLWIRILAVAQIANLPETLLLYRVHPKSISQNRRQEQRLKEGIIQKSLLNKMGLTPSALDMDTHSKIARSAFYSDTDFLDQAEKWLLKLADANQRSSFFPEKMFKKIIYEHWLNMCKAADNLNRFKTSQIAYLRPFPLRVLDILSFSE